MGKGMKNTQGIDPGVISGSPGISNFANEDHCIQDIRPESLLR